MIHRNVDIRSQAPRTVESDGWRLDWPPIDPYLRTGAASSINKSARLLRELCEVPKVDTVIPKMI